MPGRVGLIRSVTPMRAPRRRPAPPGSTCYSSRSAGHGPVGTLLGWVPGTSLPTPPTASLSSRPNADDGDHDRVAPSPVTPWQPDSCTLTGGKVCSPAANTSRTEPADAAGQCCPGGMAGSAQRAATMACTWVAPWSVTWRGAADPLTTTRSAAWPSEQSDPAAGVLAPVTGCWDEPRACRSRRRGAAGRAAAARRQPDQGRGSDQDLCCSCGHAGILPSTLGRSAAGYGSGRPLLIGRHVFLREDHACARLGDNWKPLELRDLLCQPRSESASWFKHTNQVRSSPSSLTPPLSMVTILTNLSRSDARIFSGGNDTVRMTSMNDL